MANRRPLNFREYWDAVGTANVQKIIEDCDSSMAYFRMLRYGIKRPGRDMALSILASARRHTSPYEPSLELLLAGVPRSNNATPCQQIPPSDSFLRSQRRLRAATEAA